MRQIFTGTSILSECGLGHVTRTLNAISGVKATVDLAHKTATVQSTTSVDDNTLREAVQNTGYEVTAIY